MFAPPAKRGATLQHIRLGRTDLNVSRICFGTWQFGGEWGSQEEQENIAAMRRARELGIDFFDTAQAYGYGASEQLLAKALGDELRSNRDELVIATKGGLRLEGENMVRDSSPDFLRSGVEDSLRFLGLDYIDLYQVHWPDPNTPIEETAGALQAMVDEGKIRHVGVSNYKVEHLEAFERARPVEAAQPPYHLFRRDIEGAELDWFRAHDVGVLVYSPLASGLLTGKMSEDQTFADDDWRSSSPIFEGDEFKRNLQVVRELEQYAEERGTTVTQLAVAWTLAQPGVHVAIVGARKPSHIEGSAPAAELQLTDEDLSRIEQIMEGAVPVGGPSPEGGVEAGG
jgi:aryl-alcohol dehydrogenase-like predicted oxidoreductase